MTSSAAVGQEPVDKFYSTSARLYVGMLGLSGAVLGGTSYLATRPWLRLGSPRVAPHNLTRRQMRGNYISAACFTLMLYGAELVAVKRFGTPYVPRPPAEQVDRIAAPLDASSPKPFGIDEPTPWYGTLVPNLKLAVPASMIVGLQAAALIRARHAGVLSRATFRASPRYGGKYMLWAYYLLSLQFLCNENTVSLVRLLAHSQTYTSWIKKLVG